MLMLVYICWVIEFEKVIIYANGKYKGWMNESIIFRFDSPFLYGCFIHLPDSFRVNIDRSVFIVYFFLIEMEQCKFIHSFYFPQIYYMEKNLIFWTNEIKDKQKPFTFFQNMKRVNNVQTTRNPWPTHVWNDLISFAY